MKSLAIKYRPKTWDDVTEQGSIKIILSQQIESGEIKGAYCFVGAAGTGKTTCARIFANEINHGDGVPIEMDAASHNGVDDVREIAKMANTKAIDAEYKVFILDECHLFSAGAWAAMLKLIEEPPAKCVFILCTTDYWKIPKTIQSRCQRYQFQRISTSGIADRLNKIMLEENISGDEDAIEYIARLSDGCMREAIVTLEKCVSYNENVTMDSVLGALGLMPCEVFIELADNARLSNKEAVLDILESRYGDGADMKQFVKDFLNFTLDVNKYMITGRYSDTRLPNTDYVKGWLDSQEDLEYYNELLRTLIDLDSAIKYDPSPLYTIEAKMLLLT